jgi:predicted permease
VRRTDEDFAEEIRAHLELEAEQQIAEGAAAGDAKSLARRAFGNVMHAQEYFHESRRIRWLEEFVQDLGYAMRQLRRSRAMTAAIVLTLALGVGANAVIFGVVDRLLLRAPPGLKEPGRLRRLYFRGQSPVGPLGSAMYSTPVTPFAVITVMQHSPAFAAVAGFDHFTFALGRGTDARRIDGEEVTGNYFEMLGAHPEVGRLLTATDSRPPVRTPVVVLSYNFWMQQFGGAPDVIGKSLRIDSDIVTVVGVAARDFNGVDLEKVDVWMPIGAKNLGNDDWVTTPNAIWIRSIARLAPGATDEAASRDATVLYRRLLRDWHSRAFENAPDTLSSAFVVSIIAGRGPNAPKEARVSLWLAGVAGIVLLISCANVANLLLSRAFRRRREIAVRLSIGIGRARLLRQLFVETCFLAAIAASAAIVVATIGSTLLDVILLPTSTLGSGLIDWPVVTFAVLGAVAATLLSGTVPAVQTTRLDIAGWLSTGQRDTGRRSRLQIGLSVAQAALATLLLIGAGSFVTSLRRVRSTDVGIDLSHVLLVQNSLDFATIDTSGMRAIISEEMDRLRRFSEVAHVSLATYSAPKAGAVSMPFEISGRASLGSSTVPPPFVTVIDEHFFETIGARILQGRGIDADDVSGTSHVAVINETLARSYWPNHSPLGACLVLPSYQGCTEVIGVVQNIMGWGLIEEARSQFYLPRHADSELQSPSILIRTRKDARVEANEVRRQLQSLTPEMPYVDVRSYEDLVEPDLRSWRLGATMFSAFGVLALVIAAIGLYGVLTFVVSQRAREIGVRMALGARRDVIVRHVAGEGVGIVAVGSALGVAMALGASGYIEPMLYHTSAREPAIIASVVAFLLLIALLASGAPAWRAARVDPNVALRDE